MYRALTTAVLLLSTRAFAMDGYFDIESNFDPMNVKQKSYIELSPSTYLPIDDKSWIFNPKLSFYLDGSVDVSMATGMRHTTQNGFLGHHVFWSLSQTKHGSFHQIGHSLDFLTEDWDYRVNYYHPLTKQQTDDLFKYDTHKWTEVEALWKGDHFNIGFGPKYNFSTRSIGLQTRFVIPFKFFNIGACAGYDHKHGFSSALSLSFNIYSTGRRSQLNGNISHKSRVRYGKTILPRYQKPQKHKHDETKLALQPPEDKKPESMVVEKEPVLEQEIKEIIDTTIQDIPVPEVGPDGSWWGIFRRHG